MNKADGEQNEEEGKPNPQEVLYHDVKMRRKL